MLIIDELAVATGDLPEHDLRHRGIKAGAEECGPFCTLMYSIYLLMLQACGRHFRRSVFVMYLDTSS